jgi:hypothetical protein
MSGANACRIIKYTAMDQPVYDGSLKTPKCWEIVHLTNGNRTPLGRSMHGYKRSDLRG